MNRIKDCLLLDLDSFTTLQGSPEDTSVLALSTAIDDVGREISRHFCNNQGPVGDNSAVVVAHSLLTQGLQYSVCGVTLRPPRVIRLPLALCPVIGMGKRYLEWELLSLPCVKSRLETVVVAKNEHVKLRDPVKWITSAIVRPSSDLDLRPRTGQTR
ncbi:hypothetical protein J6590_006558 [Homalodisca vitripennis]|nr:hypothetical protein J6590_006558 [Homalodisca vitripennis]